MNLARLNKVLDEYWESPISWKVFAFFFVTAFVNPWFLNQTATLFIFAKPLVLDKTRVDALSSRVLMKSMIFGRLAGLPLAWGSLLLLKILTP